MKSVICELIKSNPNWRDIISSLFINMTSDGDLVIFNYGKLEDSPNIDFSNPLVQEARGIIINIKTLEVVCWPFRKFGNWQESYVDEIDWSSARVQEKIDGSIMKLYFYNNKWNWATNGNIYADKAKANYTDKTFFEVIKSAYNYKFIDFDKLNKDYTYIFELVSFDSRVVIDYGITKLYHIGTRNNKTGEELIENIGIEHPKEYPFTTFDEAITAVAKLNEGCSDIEHEGFVVVDKNWHRIKIKTKEYFDVHHAMNNHSLTKKRIIKHILNGKDEAKVLKEEVPEYRHVIMYYEYRIEELKYEMLKTIKYARALYEEYSGNKKAVYMEIKDSPFVNTAMSYINDLDKKIDIERDFKYMLESRIIELIPDYEERKI